MTADPGAIEPHSGDLGSHPRASEDPTGVGALHAATDAHSVGVNDHLQWAMEALEP
jgi:hypothetical protein